MNCNEYKRLASARIDGQIAAGEASALDAHLASCDGCKGAERAMRAVDAGISAGPRHPVSPGFKSALFERLETESLLPVGRGRIIPFPLWRWAAVPLAAAAGLVLFLLAGHEAVEMRPGGEQLARQAVPAPLRAADPQNPVDGAARENVVRGHGVAAPAVSANASALSPEEADIVANLDLLEHPAALDDAPAALDDMLAPSVNGQV